MGAEKTKRILIVDDEPNVVTYLEALLQDEGYETCAAVDGEDGLAKVRSESPDLVTLDITMPKTSGIRLYRELKADPALKDIPVVVVTAVTGKGHDAGQFENFLATRSHVPPPEGFFSKPIDRDAFLEIIAKILGS